MVCDQVPAFLFFWGVGMVSFYMADNNGVSIRIPEEAFDESGDDQVPNIFISSGEDGGETVEFEAEGNDLRALCAFLIRIGYGPDAKAEGAKS
jgi:hypothetical protein